MLQERDLPLNYDLKIIHEELRHIQPREDSLYIPEGIPSSQLLVLHVLARLVFRLPGIAVEVSLNY